MAKKTKKKATHATSKPNDAVNLAALHWYALMIERISIQLYVTDAKNFGSVKGALNDALKALDLLRQGFATPCSECQDGWECCPSDGMCAPTCLDQ